MSRAQARVEIHPQNGNSELQGYSRHGRFEVQEVQPLQLEVRRRRVRVVLHWHPGVQLEDNQVENGGVANKQKEVPGS